MAIKSFNPYSPSRRFITVSAFEEITTDKPYRPLVEKLVRKAGRNNTGKMTVRHQGHHRSSAGLRLRSLRG